MSKVKELKDNKSTLKIEIINGMMNVDIHGDILSLLVGIEDVKKRIENELLKNIENE